MNYDSIELMLLFCVDKHISNDELSILYEDNFIYLDLSSVELETAIQFFKVLDELEFKWDDETLASQLLKKFWDSGKFKRHSLALLGSHRKLYIQYAKLKSEETLYKLNPDLSLKEVK